MTVNGSYDWVRLTELESSDAASQAGALLLESGIVATVDDDVDGDGTVLSVLPDDVSRACEILGIDEPVAAPLPFDAPLPVEATRWRIPRERIGLFAVGYLVVLIAVSIAVFFVVAWILGGFDSTEVPNVTVAP
jgi:hypothetical protein